MSTHNTFYVEQEKIISDAPSKQVRCYSFFSKSVINFSDFFIKSYVVGTNLKRLTEALQMSTHNICFYGELDKNYPKYPSLASYLTVMMFSGKVPRS